MKIPVENTDSKKKHQGFEHLSNSISKAAGTTPVFIGAILLIVIWGIFGPFYNFSQDWQLLISTTTTIITFLMVFIIQKAQNKDSLAIHLKLNELLASHNLSSNSLVDIENMTEEEMKIVQKYYQELNQISSKSAKREAAQNVEDHIKQNIRT